MKKIFLLILGGYLVLGVFRPFSSASAAGLNVPLSTEPRSYVGERGLATYISDLYRFGLGLGAMLAMTMIVIGATRYTLSAGNIDSQSDAKDQILNAVYGLALLLCIFLVLSTINPAITNLPSLITPNTQVPPPAKGDVPPATFLIFNKIELEPGRPLIDLLWQDNCPPTFACTFAIQRIHARGGRLEDVTRTGIAAQRYQIQPHQAFIGDWWRIVAVSQDEVAAESGLGQQLQITADLLPPAPNQPILEKDVRPRLTIVDTSYDEVQFVLYKGFTDALSISTEIFFRDGAQRDSTLPVSYDIPSRDLQNCYRVWKVQACNGSGICSAFSPIVDVSDWVPPSADCDP